jgi:hypothetical protein
MSVNRCTKCILPANYPGISFQEDGVCSFCADFRQPDWRVQRYKLDEIIETVRSSGSRYQAVVPFSGGKDSSYVLYYMRKVCNLRVLALNFDNAFRSPTAELNLETLPKTLDVDYTSIHVPWPLMRALYAAFIKDAGEFCTVCNSVGYLTIMSYIVSHANILGPSPLVVSGWVRYLEEMPNVYAFDIRYFRDIISRAGLLEALTGSGFVDQRCLEILANSPDPRTLNDDARIPLNFIALPEYIYWDVNEISETLKALGWNVPSSATGETHFDCTMYPVAKYLERKKYGFSQSTITYSALVRHGQMTREDAIKELDRESNDKPVEFADFLGMLGLDENQVNYKGKWYPERK